MKITLIEILALKSCAANFMANNKTSVNVCKLKFWCVYLLSQVSGILTRVPPTMDLNDDELIVFTNYELKLYRAFSNFFWNNEFTDALLKCENKLVRVHKFLLSAKSSYFDKIFRQNSVDDCEVPIENVTFDILLVVLEYVYHGRVAIQQSQLSPFMEAANRFSIEIGSGQIDLISVNEQSNDSGGQNSPSSSCSDLYISSGKNSFD